MLESPTESTKTNIINEIMNNINIEIIRRIIILIHHFKSFLIIEKMSWFIQTHLN